jgi:hypothetical protein
VRESEPGRCISLTVASLMEKLYQLILPQGPVDRSRYLHVGAAFVIFKYLVDWLVYRLLFGDWWSWTEYMTPLFAQRLASAPEAANLPMAYAVFLLVWSLLFAWIGAQWSARRAVDAGGTPWWGLVLFVPLLNYLMIAILVVLPTQERRDVGAAKDAEVESLTFRTTITWGLGLLLAMALMYWVLIELNNHYGTVLFLSLPVLFGVLVGYTANVKTRQSVGRTLGLALLCAVAASVILLSLSLEGIVCVVMAFPVISVSLMVGSLLGRSFVVMGAGRPGPLQSLGVLFILPMIAWSDGKLPKSAARQVSSSIEIDAPPSVVWENVVSFSPLPEPTSGIFTTGIAYPIGARIEGQGVGAIRYCDFSTGSFVEPITVWDAPRRLAFSVREQPETMKEWGLFGPVHPPHLENTFRSVRGEFRLVPLEGGRTLLEGSTWYELDMAPEVYWRLWGDGIVQSIHGRVLQHIKALAEE